MNHGEVFVLHLSLIDKNLQEVHLFHDLELAKK